MQRQRNPDVLFVTLLTLPSQPLVDTSYLRLFDVEKSRAHQQRIRTQRAIEPWREFLLEGG